MIVYEPKGDDPVVPPEDGPPTEIENFEYGIVSSEQEQSGSTFGDRRLKYVVGDVDISVAVERSQYLDANPARRGQSVIWIDLEHKLPTDSDIPGWVPWSDERWEAWKATSAQFVTDMAALDASGDKATRNKLIDDHSAHWTQLKPWLSALSGGKCWFSETRNLYAHYDVEHFRPKKSAKSVDGNDRDGYWWLAFSYTNFRLCGNVGNRKKGGWFPLQAGSPCASYANQCEDMEVRYFLDPIDIEDVKLVAFDEEGNLVPNPHASDWEKERVELTALRLKLNEHDQLPEERRKIWARTTRWINQYLTHKSRCADGANLVARQKTAEAARAIHELTRPTSELSVVARWCVEFRNDPRLMRLAA